MRSKTLMNNAATTVPPTVTSLDLHSQPDQLLVKPAGGHVISNTEISCKVDEMDTDSSIPLSLEMNGSTILLIPRGRAAPFHVQTKEEGPHPVASGRSRIPRLIGIFLPTHLKIFWTPGN